jgi:hypothetical protein
MVQPQYARSVCPSLARQYPINSARGTVVHPAVLEARAGDERFQASVDVSERFADKRRLSRPTA